MNRVVGGKRREERMSRRLAETLYRGLNKHSQRGVLKEIQGKRNSANVNNKFKLPRYTKDSSKPILGFNLKTQLLGQFDTQPLTQLLGRFDTQLLGQFHTQLLGQFNT